MTNLAMFLKKKYQLVDKSVLEIKQDEGIKETDNDTKINFFLNCLNVNDITKTTPNELKLLSVHYNYMFYINYNITELGA